MSQATVTPTSHDAWRVRGWSLAGAGLIFTALWLGFIWPGLFTLVALFVAPALILLLSGVFWPPLYVGRPGLRRYLRACLMLAALSWLLELAWLTFSPG